MNTKNEVSLSMFCERMIFYLVSEVVRKKLSLSSTTVPPHILVSFNIVRGERQVKCSFYNQKKSFLYLRDVYHRVNDPSTNIQDLMNLFYAPINNTNPVTIFLLMKTFLFLI